MVLPDAENSASRPDVGALAPRTTLRLSPLASAIWEATVRFQMRSYTLASSDLAPNAAWAADGSWNSSPAGRIASWASWAFFTLPE